MSGVHLHMIGRFRRRGVVAAIVTVLLIVAALAGTTANSAHAATASRSAAAGSGTRAVIAVDARQQVGEVQSAVTGHADLWPFAGMGSYDTTTDNYYPSFVRQLTDVVKPGSLRWPGGITGEAYHWERAVGPADRRSANAFGPASGPSESDVGPDEFGALLDRTGATGVVTTNFGTGTAQEAAAFIAYMTGAPGSSRWADLRVRNGHRAPYQVPYWEVGNEEYSANYWRSGTPVTVNGPDGACQQVATCLYIYGGSTSFTNQAVVRYADRTANAALSTGDANQVFYAAYAPVQPGSATVKVAGTPWTGVADLAAAGPSDDVYTLDPTTGEVAFGDGTHGAVPPAGAKLTISYVSGPHTGFVDYYRLMKRANPKAQICSTDTTDDFVASMGSKLPYDCLQSHTYTSTSTVPNNAPIAQYEDAMIGGAESQADGVAQLQATIRADAGHDVPLVETEYGQLLSSNPDGYPYYHESLDEALLNATQLADWIRLGIPVADRQLLAAEIPPPDNCCAGLPNAAPYASTAAIGTPGPNTVLEATGEVYNLFAHITGGSLLGVRTLDNPALPNATSAAALSVLAVRRQGQLDLLVINRSTTDSVPSQLALGGVLATGTGAYTRLDAISSLSYNTATAPNAVRLSSGRVRASGSQIATSFPAHSVTLLRLPVRPTGPQHVSVAAAAQPTLVAPGGRLTLTTTLRNDSRKARSVRVQPVLPAAWTVTPKAVDVVVGRDSTVHIPLQISIPADAAEARETPGVIVSARDGDVEGVATANLVVRDLRSWSSAYTDNFDEDAVGSPPAGYTVSGPPGTVTVQAAPDSGGHVLQVQRTAGQQGMISADRALPVPDGDSRLVLRARAGQTDAALGVQLLDSTGAAVAKLSLATSGDVAWSDGTAFVRGASYTANTWHTYEMDLDPASGTYKFYIDDVLLAQPKLASATGALAYLRLQIPESPATPGSFDIDNISFDLPGAQ